MSRTRRKAENVSRWYRKPKTQQERREAGSCIDGVKPRAKRNAKNLPTAWDDQIRSDIYEKPKRLDG